MIGNDKYVKQWLLHPIGAKQREGEVQQRRQCNKTSRKHIRYQKKHTKTEGIID
jgi:hypothetical protein